MVLAIVSQSLQSMPKPPEIERLRRALPGAKPGWNQVQIVIVKSVHGKDRGCSGFLAVEGIREILCQTRFSRSRRSGHGNDHPALC